MATSFMKDSPLGHAMSSNSPMYTTVPPGRASSTARCSELSVPPVSRTTSYWPEGATAPMRSRASNWWGWRTSTATSLTPRSCAEAAASMPMAPPPTTATRVSEPIDPRVPRGTVVLTHPTRRRHAQRRGPGRTQVEVASIALWAASASEDRFDGHCRTVVKDAGELVSGDLPAPPLEVLEIGGTDTRCRHPYERSVAIRLVDIDDLDLR